MRYPSLFFASVMMLIFILYIGYKPWIKPGEYIIQIKKRREEINQNSKLLPISISNKFFKLNPKADLRWMRFSIIIGVLMCTIGILAAIFGP